MAVMLMALTWLKILMSLVEDARMVVSEMGESLSPKMAPERTAPTMTSTGIPMLTPTLTQAMPTVPAVLQELPIQLQRTAQSRKKMGRTHWTSSQPRP